MKKELFFALVASLATVLFYLGSCEAGSSISISPLRQPRNIPNILHNLAVDRLLKDKGFVMSVINCVLDKGPCNDHGRHMKRLAPEILRGHCPGCNRNIHNQVRRVISHIQRNFPQEWSEVMNRFLRSPAQHLQTSLFG